MRSPFACVMPERRRSCNLLLPKPLYSLPSAPGFGFFPPLGCGHSNPGKTKRRAIPGNEYHTRPLTGSAAEITM